MSYSKPRFVIKNKFQKRAGSYSHLLSDDILRDVCFRITGRRDYDCEFDDIGYNKGRMATLEYNGATAFISFSDTEADGRNSSFQSISSALNSYYLDASPPKRICFYFLPSSGKFETPYFLFMYRLMMTAGIEFLNHNSFLSQDILPFISVEDMIAAKNVNRVRNRSNNSTYVTLGDKHTPQIYGKTYGASKYETTLLAVALSKITNTRINLFEIQEQELKELPKRSLKVIKSLDIHVIPTSITMERKEFEKNNSLRSPRYIYNLLAKLGAKKCYFCGCEIPEIIQGAHIWPVADIKKSGGLTDDERLHYATNGDNGLWLCENHHKLMDEGIISISSDGSLTYSEKMGQHDIDFINRITPVKMLPQEIITSSFLFFLKKRNETKLLSVKKQAML